MPIRMVEDENNEQEYNPQNNNNGGNQAPRNGGGLGMLGAILPFILKFVFKKPLIAIPLILIGGYFIFSNNNASQSNNALQAGCDMKQEVYDKAEVFAGMEEDATKNPLPEYVSLAKFAPTRLDQGEQGSCVGWGSAYAARTILEAASTGQNPDAIAMSPSFLYNNIGFENCQGAYINKAMEFMQKVGTVPLKNFAYTAQSCSREPNQELIKFAQNYKIKGFNRLTKDGDDYSIDFYAIKQHLAAGAPVVIGMMVGNSFMRDMYGQKLWQPTEEDYDMEGFGGHCMCIIGYDDRLAGGSFQIMNSWGTQWGENGIAWVKYKDFMHFNKEAYGLYPLAKKGSAAQTQFACNIGLVDMSTKKYIPLKNNSANIFSNNTPVAKGTKFKIEIENTVECNIYIFGQETDGSSYVLFPYTKKHTAFCGITGYRLFPKDFSMQADNIGNKDYMAIVVTKEPINYNQINATITANKTGDYASKVMQALNGTNLTNVKYVSSNGRLGFQAATENKNAVVMVVEINKQ